MNKDLATSIVTAFATFAELTAACKRGYVPTLTVGHDDLPTRRAKAVLVSALTANGFKVFE